ncbi:hypothetical protein TWF694_006338 [Orbilia ellipsospora]|uniref:Uncharacterized protein n=1 Tax=Orbilia ellipsospora TaxID=2528407 RepID=A0AAV9XLA8_9PEZI
MRIAIAIPFIYAALAVTGVLADCAHDNCLRAIIASAVKTRSGVADCASYFAVATITPPPSTVTVTVAHTVTKATDTIQPARQRRDLNRRITAAASIPAYASACSGLARYSSACSCVGVAVGGTFTAPTPVTTVTVTSTTTIPLLSATNYPDVDCGLTPFSTYNVANGECVHIWEAYGVSVSTALTPASCLASHCHLGLFYSGDCTGDPADTIPLDGRCIYAASLYSYQLVCDSTVCP